MGWITNDQRREGGASALQLRPSVHCLLLMTSLSHKHRHVFNFAILQMNDQIQQCKSLGHFRIVGGISGERERERETTRQPVDTLTHELNRLNMVTWPRVTSQEPAALPGRKGLFAHTGQSVWRTRLQTTVRQLGYNITGRLMPVRSAHSLQVLRSWS